MTPENAAALRQAWDPYWDLSARYLVEKSPPNLVMGRFLQALFPDSSMIVVIRHPVVVALSNKKWRKMLSSDPRRFQTVSSLVQHWVTAHRVFLQDLPHLRRLHVVHYEDLVADPEGECARISAFLQLDTPIPTGTLSRARAASTSSGGTVGELVASGPLAAPGHRGALRRGPRVLRLRPGRPVDPPAMEARPRLDQSLRPARAAAATRSRAA